MNAPLAALSSYVRAHSIVETAVRPFVKKVKIEIGYEGRHWFSGHSPFSLAAWNSDIQSILLSGWKANQDDCSARSRSRRWLYLRQSAPVLRKTSCRLKAEKAVRP